MKPTCRKRRFRDKVAADLAITKRQRNDQRRERTEVRSYLCPSCHKWHLTSMSKADVTC
jgi:hypothetical protein